VELESVRSLKLELADRLVTPVARPKGMSGFGVAARSLDAVQSVQPAIALGVAPNARRGYKLAVRIQHRRVGAELEAEIREAAKGEVDVRYIGRIVKRAGRTPQQSRRRPVAIGVSVGHVSVTAGTLGCFVRVGTSRRPHILSNNHVLANENLASRGDLIVQPGRFDGGRPPRDAVASLQKFVKLKQRGVNHVDCAAARLDGGIDFDALMLGRVGAFSGAVVQPEDLVAVEKIGRTSGHTVGKVTAFDVDRVVVEYDLGNLRFDGQIEIEGKKGSFSHPGDSGSLIFASGTFEAGALLFSGSDQGGSTGTGLTYANPISTVFTQLGAGLLP
jgi:hypothetical protein